MMAFETLAKTAAKRGLNHLLDWLIPCHCALCEMRSQRPVDLCRPCEDDMPWLRAACKQCALPLGDVADGDHELRVCGRCLRQPPAFDRTLAACWYGEPISGFIHGLKYSGDFSRVAILSTLLARRVRPAIADGNVPDFMVPMPLHWVRRWRRGFNQAEEIARHLCGCEGLEPLATTLRTDLCRRIRATPSQRTLTANQRRSNLRQAFCCREDISGLSIAIVDDVLTTGASADALARSLKSAGAARVEVWCCARTSAPS